MVYFFIYKTWSTLDSVFWNQHLSYMLKSRHSAEIQKKFEYTFAFAIYLALENTDIKIHNFHIQLCFTVSMCLHSLKSLTFYTKQFQFFLKK